MDVKRAGQQSITPLLYIILFLFPLLGGCISLAWRRMKGAKQFFWIFCVFLGLIHIFHPEGTVLGEGTDGGRYALELIYMHDYIDSFDELIGTLYNESELDIYQPILTYIISRFTDNPHWLFFCFAIVYGFFYSRNIWYLFDRLPDKFPKILWILIAYYILVCPIWYINGVRMWTALHIFVYGAMPYLIEGKKRGLIWCFLSLLVHFSYFLPLIILLLYSFNIFRNAKLLFVFYICTLFISSVDLNFFKDLLSYIPFLESKGNAYLNEEYLATLNSVQHSFNVIISEGISKWVIHILVIVVYFYYKVSNNKRSDLNRLFSFALLLYGVSNILSLMPSGGRFVLLSNMFMLPFSIYVFTYCIDIKKIKFLDIIYLLIIPIVFQIRIGLDFYGVMLFIGNFITSPFIISDIPLTYYIL